MISKKNQLPELKPGAYSVSASSTRALHGPGMLTPTKQTQSSRRRNQSRYSDSGTSERYWRIDFRRQDMVGVCEQEPALYVGGGCLLAVVILAVSIPLSLVESEPPAPTASPTSPRLQFYDSIRSAVVNSHWRASLGKSKFSAVPSF